MNKNIRNIFRIESNNTFIQLFRYTIVGGVAFVVDYSLLISLTELCGIHYLTSASLSFMAGLTVNYLLSKHYVFNHSVMGNRLLEFLIFALIGIIGLVLNELFLWLFTAMFDFHYMFSKLITTGVVYLWNFFARKYILFNK